MDTILGAKVRKLRFFSSIRTKFALSYFSVIAIVLLAMNTYFLTASRDMIFSSKRALVQNQAATIAVSLENAFSSLNKEDVQRVMASLDVVGVSHIVITDSDGMSAVYDPAEKYSQAEFPVAYVLRALECYDIYFADYANGVFSSSAVTPVVSKGEIIGAVYVNDEDAGQGAILIDMQSTLKNISITVAAISMAIVIFIVLSLMRRVTSILKAIKSVREGEYNYQVSIRGNDELAILGDEFNSLTTRLRETDEVRRKFVANASHELKTPLASIRLLSDSILQNENIAHETVQEFISDIGAEAERLTRTTEKLLSLSKLDSHITDDRTVIDVRNVVAATLRMLTPLVGSSALVLEQELGEGCYILGSEDSVHQVVFNLIENAIKYNKPGGIVTVRLEVEGDDVVLTIDDTGVGVPDEDMPYIFDRFYRVDKARSREAGGSGLGLSIVMVTVQELGGTVTAAQRVGGGMSFQVRLKRETKQLL